MKLKMTIRKKTTVKEMGGIVPQASLHVDIVINGVSTQAVLNIPYDDHHDYDPGDVIHLAMV